MKHLVIGGAGFIGSHLVDALSTDDVYVLDDLSTGSLDNLPNFPQDHFMRADIRNLDAVKSALAGMDTVYMLAALPRVVRSVEDPVGTHSVNVTGFLNVLQGCREVGIKKLVYASSSSVYGAQSTHFMEEKMIPHPLSPYALHKSMDEQYAEMFSRLFGIKTVGLRFFNVYGERQSTEGAYALVIGKFLKMKAEGKKLTVFGDGTQTRDYTYVSDIVRGCFLAQAADTEGHVVINLGTGQETSVNEIAALVGGEVEFIIPNPRGQFEEARKCADISLARDLLSWEPQITIQEGIGTLL